MKAKLKRIADALDMFAVFASVAMKGILIMALLTTVAPVVLR